jgi:hypothetical protein
VIGAVVLTALLVASAGPKDNKPSAKEVIEAALSLGDLPLKNGETCVSFSAATGVGVHRRGTEPDEHTTGGERDAVPDNRVIDCPVL